MIFLIITWIKELLFRLADWVATTSEHPADIYNNCSTSLMSIEVNNTARSINFDPLNAGLVSKGKVLLLCPSSPSPLPISPFRLFPSNPHINTILYVCPIVMNMLTLKSTFKSSVMLGYTSHYKHFFLFSDSSIKWAQGIHLNNSCICTPMCTYTCVNVHTYIFRSDSLYKLG